LIIDIKDYADPAAASRELSQVKLIPEADVITSSVTTSEDDTSSSNSGPNLGLILGVSIPVGLLRKFCLI
jgi:hypothetical protein